MSDLFDRGLRRSRQLPLHIVGTELRDANGLAVCFSLAVDGGTITKVGFRTSVCVTLIAYCELVAELMEGAALEGATPAPGELIGELPGVPPLKHDRAVLAIGAFRAALAAVRPQQSSDQSSARRSNESRLHLCHAAS